MANELNEYMSDLYDISSKEDMRQTVEYKYVKAYPSVNSTNGSPIHSEANVRWLTKQFTKKPFIIPRDGEPTGDKFKTRTSASGQNGTYVYGGIANIGGYIISIANDINDVQFDYSGNTEFGSNSQGIIWTQIVQRTMIAITKQLEDADFVSDDNGYISAIRQAISDKGEEITPETIKAQANEFYAQLMGDAVTEEPVIGEVTIEYKNEDNLKIVEYIDNLPDDERAMFAEEYDSQSVKYYTATYPVTLGFPKTYYTIEDETIPFVYIVDNFGFIYNFYNAEENTDNQAVLTHYYPSTRDPRINMQNIHVGLGNISGRPGADHIINTMIPNNEVYDVNECYLTNERDDILPSTVSFDSVLSNFDNIATKDVLSIYGTLSGVDIETITSMPNSNEPLADNYYCIPMANTSNNTYAQLVRHFATPIQDGSAIMLPISVFNSAGILTPKNIKIYNGDDTYVSVMGYVTFMRKLAKLLVNPAGKSYNGEEFNADYYDNPNGDNIDETTLGPFRRCWSNIFKYLEDIGIDSTNDMDSLLAEVFNDDIQELCDFFGITYSGGFDRNDVTRYQFIKFHHLYNTLIAPFMNTYMQIAWTALFSNGVINDKYCPPKCLKYYRDIASSVGVELVDDEYWSAVAKLSHHYTVTDNGHTVDMSYRFTENADIYTDNERMETYLCSQEKIPFITKVEDNVEKTIVSYREKLNLDTSNPNSVFAECEDYISYIIRCSSPTRKINHTNDIGDAFIMLMSIPYRITNLVFGNNIKDNDITVNKVLDIDRYYADNTDYPTTAPIHTDTRQLGYIQNVQIDINTMLPCPIDSYDSLRIDNGRTFWYYIDNQYEKQSSKSTYNLMMTNINTNDYYDVGLNGFNFIGYSQSWATFVPIVFRLYKDGQDYLAGKNPGESTDAGIYVDYRFPKYLKDTDLWFASAWLNTRRTCINYNIENNGADYSTNTDGLLNYLKTRNETIFDVDKIYTKNEKGEFTSFNQYVNNLVENNTIVQEIEEVKFDGYEKCVSVSSYWDFGSLLSIDATDNYLYIDTNTQPLDELTVRLNNINLNYKDTDISNTIRIKTVVKNGTEIILNAPNQTDTGSSSILPMDGISICNCENVFTRNNTGTFTTYTTKLNTRNNDIIESLITITLTPEKEHYITIEPINGNTYPTIFGLNYLIKQSLGVTDLDKITWDKVSEFTQEGLAPMLWNIGDTKTFKIVDDYGNLQEFTALIVGFDCDPNINNESSGISHHIMWMTNFGNATTEELKAIGMKQDDQLGFKVNFGVTASQDLSYDYDVNTPSAYSNNIIYYGSPTSTSVGATVVYSHNNISPIEAWFMDLEHTDASTITHKHQFVLDDTPIYRLITLSNKDIYWQEGATVYTLSGDTYTAQTITSNSPQYADDTYYYKTYNTMDILVRKQHSDSWFPESGVDIDNLNEAVHSYNIMTYGENNNVDGYTVTTPFSAVSTTYPTANTSNAFWLPSLKELGVTEQMYSNEVNDWVEQSLYDKVGTDIRRGNVGYRYTEDNTIWINNCQETYTAFKPQYINIFQSRPYIITRDCFAVYKDSVNLETDWQCFSKVASTDNAQYMAKNLVRVVFQGVGNKYGEFLVQPRDDVTNPQYYRTEFCFATK